MSDEPREERTEEREAAETDARFVAFLRREAALYHAPPETPADCLWPAIEAEWQLAAGGKHERDPAAGDAADPVAPARDLLRAGAAAYHRPPPEAPREEMWARVEAAWRLRTAAPPEAREAGWEAIPAGGGRERSADGGPRAEGEAAPGRRAPSAAPDRSTRPSRLLWPLGVAAALVLGVLIGRGPTSTPGDGPGSVAAEVGREPALAAGDRSEGPPTAATDGPPVAATNGPPEERAGTARRPDEPRAERPRSGGASLEAERRLAATRRTAAERHLARAETFLTAFRVGEPHFGDGTATGRWARDLLGQTRLLLDWSAGEDPSLRDLLETLELVLVQIVRLEEGASGREWVLDAMERGNVLSRLRAAGT